MSLKRKAADAATAAAASKKTKANGSITAFFGAPKTTPKAEVNFSKDEWVAELSDEQRELLELEIDTLHDSWLPHLRDVLVSPQFLELKRFLKKELQAKKTVYPPMRDVYSWYVKSSQAVDGSCIALHCIACNSCSLGFRMAKQ
jgi:uracil-DNA glycosylase